MPSKLAGAGKSVGRYGFLSLGYLLRFLIRHWYLSIFIIIMFPAIIGSVSEAIETRNPIHPFLQLGKRILTADVVVGEDVALLEEQGVEAFVGMPKPTDGYWQKTKYYWFFFWRLIFRIFGNVWLIFVPLIAIYKLGIKWRQTSEVTKNILRSVGIFALYLFIVNILFIMYKLVTDQIAIILPEGATEFQQILHLFVYLLPFNGLFSLVKYLIVSMA